MSVGIDPGFVAGIGNQGRVGARSPRSDARPSGLTVQDSARLGVRWLPGIGFTRASCMA